MQSYVFDLLACHNSMSKEKITTRNELRIIDWSMQSVRQEEKPRPEESGRRGAK